MNLFLSARALVGALTLLAVGSAQAATYYVSTSGNDGNAGTLANPWRTIQKAANTAVAGDTVNIRGGTDRESVTLPTSGTPSSKIVFQGYPGETAIVSGCDVVSGWTLESSNLYYAPMGWDLAEGNQVFISNVMQYEARWPNNTGALLEPSAGAWATADTVTNKTNLVDAALSAAPGTHVGATLSILSGKAWIMKTTPVTGYNDGTNTLTISLINPDNTNYRPLAGNEYFLSGLKAYADSDEF